jgi:hypothetical protein
MARVTSTAAFSSPPGVERLNVSNTTIPSGMPASAAMSRSSAMSASTSDSSSRFAPRVMMASGVRSSRLLRNTTKRRVIEAPASAAT